MKNVLIAFFAICLSSCSGIMQEDAGLTLDGYKEAWRRFNEAGRYDSLINQARPLYEQSLQAGDYEAMLYSSVFMAQAWLFMDNHADSVSVWLLKAENCIDGMGKHVDPAVMTIYENVCGSHALKSGLDYTHALEHYLRALQWAEKARNINNRIIILSNIVQIYYIRSDTRGLRYAETALELSADSDAGDFSKCLALMDMGQMLFLNGRLPESEDFAERSSRLAHKKQYISLYPLIALLYGNIYSSKGDLQLAETAYNEAMSYAGYTDPGTVTLVMLDYGRYCYENGRYEDAVSRYLSGLDLSYRTGNLEFREELLKGLSRSYYKKGEKDKAAKFFYDYASFADSVSNTQKEQDFSNFLLTYSRLRYEKRILVAVFAVTVAAVVGVFLYILYRRQRKMYRLLVTQYMQTLEYRSSAGMEELQNKDEETDRLLFDRIEALMRKEKVYRNKDLSRDSLAAMLQTNRTYVSRAINNVSGKTFYSYLSGWRVSEAARLLSDSKGDVSPKQLADELGFASVSVFYKVFQRETGFSVRVYKNELKAIEQENNRKIRQFDGE